MLRRCNSFLNSLFRCDFRQINHWLLLMYVVRLSLFSVIRIAVDNCERRLLITALIKASQGYIVFRDRDIVRWIRTLSSLHRHPSGQLTRPLVMILRRWIELLLVHDGFFPIYICYGHLIHKATPIVVHRAVTDLWQTILVRAGADWASSSSRGIFVIKQFMTCGVSNIVVRYFVALRRTWHHVLCNSRLLLAFPVRLIHSLVCKHARVFCPGQDTRDKLIHFRCLMCQRYLRALWNLSLFGRLIFIQRLLLFLSTVLDLLCLAVVKLLWSTVAVHSSQVLIRRSHHSSIDCRHHHSFRFVRHSNFIELLSLSFCGTIWMMSSNLGIFLGLLPLSCSLGRALCWLGIESFVSWWRQI